MSIPSPNDNDHAVAAERSTIQFRRDRPLACIVLLPGVLVAFCPAATLVRSADSVSIGVHRIYMLFEAKLLLMQTPDFLSEFKPLGFESPK